ncbi:MAG: DUF169 domain-containing protein [Ignavibacteriales bacterium]|nr:DUF169 domain-containing protein [Ignavibacteriales bacterium]
MEIEFKQSFIEKWNRYFSNSELPISFYYTDDIDADAITAAKSEQRCLMSHLNKVRDGASIYFEANTIGCTGGKRYLGFSHKLRPNFDYFLSCGIEGELEGERYKKSPQIVHEVIKFQPPFESPGKYIVFKRWDNLNELDEPMVVIFFAHPDVLSGLFTLAGFEEVRADAVIVPFSSGCGSVVYHPYKEAHSENPRAVLGMFDVSARPFVPDNDLTFSIPMRKFIEMVNNMDESFLVTDSWLKIKQRIIK